MTRTTIDRWPPASKIQFWIKKWLRSKPSGMSRSTLDVWWSNRSRMTPQNCVIFLDAHLPWGCLPEAFYSICPKYFVSFSRGVCIKCQKSLHLLPATVQWYVEINTWFIFLKSFQSDTAAEMCHLCGCAFAPRVFAQRILYHWPECICLYLNQQWYVKIHTWCLVVKSFQDDTPRTRTPRSSLW